MPRKYSKTTIKNVNNNNFEITKNQDLVYANPLAFGYQWKAGKSMKSTEETH